MTNVYVVIVLKKNIKPWMNLSWSLPSEDAKNIAANRLVSAKLALAHPCCKHGDPPRCLRFLRRKRWWVLGLQLPGDRVWTAESPRWRSALFSIAAPQHRRSLFYFWSEEEVSTFALPTSCGRGPYVTKIRENRRCVTPTDFFSSSEYLKYSMNSPIKSATRLIFTFCFVL